MDKIGTEFDRGDLARAISENTGIDEDNVLAVLKEAPEVIASALAEFGRFEWRDFGTFTLANRAAKKGHNFQTHETIDIPARKKIKFRTAPSVREAISSKTGGIVG